MSRIWIVYLLGLLPHFLWAQLDSMPYFPGSPASSFEVGPPKSRFNRKDAVMMVMRQTSIYGQFKNPYDSMLVRQFQFADINGDTYPDALYPGTGATQRTFLSVMKDMRYVLWLDEPGFLADWDSVGSQLHLTLREDAQAPEKYLHNLRRFAIDKRSGNHALLWQLSWFGSQIPAQTFEVPLLRETATSTRVRHSAEIKDEPIVDYNNDKKPDGHGNVIATLPSGTRVRVLSAVKNGADDFLFVFAPAKGLAPGHILYGIEGKPAWVGGWVLASDLKEL